MIESKLYIPTEKDYEFIKKCHNLLEEEENRYKKESEKYIKLYLQKKQHYEQIIKTKTEEYNNFKFEIKNKIEEIKINYINQIKNICDSDNKSGTKLCLCDMALQNCDDEIKNLMKELDNFIIPQFSESKIMEECGEKPYRKPLYQILNCIEYDKYIDLVEKIDHYEVINHKINELFEQKYNEFQSKLYNGKLETIFEIGTNTLYITFVKGKLIYKYDNVNPSDYYFLQYKI